MYYVLLLLLLYPYFSSNLKDIKVNHSFWPLKVSWALGTVRTQWVSGDYGGVVRKVAGESGIYNDRLYM